MLNNDEAIAVGTILRYVMGMPVDTGATDVPQATVVFNAARRLARAADKVRDIGLTPNDVDEHWPDHTPAEQVAGPAGKPPVPSNPFAAWPRIPVDDSDESPFTRLVKFGATAADMWTFGPDGPFQSPQPPAQATRGQIREALLHLLELGLLDIDTSRLAETVSIPGSRQCSRPPEGTPDAQASH
jgi:hypothetical protein